MTTAEGLLLLDKPEGPTSHDVVARVRKLTGQPRVGHAGTLDPMATGLLPLVLGRATRLVRFLPASPKVYRGSLRLGLTTSTDDITGDVLSRHDAEPPDPEQVVRAARDLTGSVLQRPPVVSARRIAGSRMYRLARAGKSVEPAPTRVEVSRFDLAPGAGPVDWEFEAEVSGGTYIRALARDLGERLGCGGTLTALRRVSIGPMHLAGAHPLPARGAPDAGPLASLVIPIEAMPLAPPPVELRDQSDIRGFLHGRAVTVPDPGPGSGLRRVLDCSGRLLGVAEADAGTLRPRVVLAPRD